MNLVRHKAHQLLGRVGFTEADRADLQQELMIELLRKMKYYDPARGKKTTFMERVLKNHVTTIIRTRIAGSRSWHRCLTSLDEPLSADATDDASTHLDQISYTDLVGREGIGTVEHEMHPLRIDIARVLDRLPENLRLICERLKEISVAELAREMGVPRSTIYEKRKQIRRAFSKAGLQVYLKSNPTV
jgi:RNA polymerase sigma-70 factor (ECF subfamily)